MEKRKTIKDHPGPCCFHGYWDSDDPLLNKQIGNVPQYIDKPRDCFWPYKEGMTLEGGDRQQKEEIENRRLRKSHRLMKYGLILSGIAAASGIVYVIDLVIGR